MKLGKWYYSSRVYVFPFFFHAKNGVGVFRFLENELRALEFAPLLRNIVDKEFSEAKFQEEAAQKIIKTIFDTSENWRFDMGYMRQLQRKE